ncbi:MAG: complexin-2 [Eubacterium sp.]
MEKKKNVTIPEELFIDLVKYFLADIRWDEDRIRSGLQEKLEAMVKRKLYTRYKTAGTSEERERGKAGVFRESRYAGELQIGDFCLSQ